MKIAIIMEYTNNKVGVQTLNVSEEMLPLDVAPNMVCDKLEEMPTGAVYLGKSIPHHYPSDVIVIPINDKQEKELDSIYKVPVSELEPGESPEYYEEFENEIRAQAAIKLAKSFM